MDEMKNLKTCARARGGFIIGGSRFENIVAEETSGSSSARLEKNTYMWWGLLVYQISSAHAGKMPWLVVGCVVEERARRDFVGQKRKFVVRGAKKGGAEIA